MAHTRPKHGSYYLSRLDFFPIPNFFCSEKKPTFFIKSLPPLCLQNIPFDGSPVLHQYHMLPPPRGNPCCWKLGQPFEPACFLHAEKHRAACWELFVFLSSSLGSLYRDPRLTRDQHEERLPVGPALAGEGGEGGGILSARPGLQLWGPQVPVGLMGQSDCEFPA